MKSFFTSVLGIIFLVPALATGLAPDSIYKDNIQTVRLFKAGNQLSFPVLKLNSNDQLELHFDDLDADVKNYYYTFLLCDFDWTPSTVMPMEYLSGFSQNRISQYRFSSVALTRYTHYQALLPEAGARPKKSGNYILKVYLNSDTSQLVFTKRVLVVEQKAVVNGSVTQANAARYFNRFQKLVFNVNVNNTNSIGAQQQLRVTLLKNFRWDVAMENVKPTFIRGNNLEFNSESIGVFPGGREWRWLDLRDFHLQTDRVATADYNKNSTDIFLRTDRTLEGQPYIYYPDLNGLSSIQAVRGINPFFEGDYAMVYFSFYPPEGRELPGAEIYLYGQLTNYSFTDSLRMRFNRDKQIYETRLLLKQGYYDYTYLAKDLRPPYQISGVDGDIFETENTYMVLVYYRPFGSRTDELIAVSAISSRPDKRGVSF